VATTTSRATARRDELAAFLRTRRERIRPEDVGLPPGHRRRTAGLRREEVAQLAGVGVTWYTWLEQGRPINASSQVLDAIARTLRLDPVERTHLYRLADVPGSDQLATCTDCPLPAEVQQVLDAFSAVPACVVNERFDLLAWNAMYATVLPRAVSAPVGERNTLLSAITAPPCCNALGDPEVMCEVMIGHLRANYGKHIGDPAWTHFIRRLEGASPAFARIWAGHDVAAPTSYVKGFRHPGVGLIHAVSTSFAVQAVPGARMVVYTPSDVESRIALDKLAAGEGTDAHFPCWPTHAPELAMAADTGMAVLRPVIAVPRTPSPGRWQVKET
jgi:transcriptional regulator with XRE-family HTH domain